MSELQAAVWEFNKQISDGEITGARTVELWIESFGPHDRLIVAKGEGGKIKGYMKYSLNLPECVEDIDDMESDDMRQLGFGDYDIGSVAKVKYIESFPMKKGTGKAMMDALKSLPWIKGIYLSPTSSSIGFYKKESIGFEESKVLMRTGRFNLPYEERYMVWKDHGR
jgi:hypothetical protein